MPPEDVFIYNVFLTFSSLNLPVIFIHYKPRIAAAILNLDEDDLMWVKK